MEKKQSMEFLQQCMDSMKNLSKKEIDEMRRIYESERNHVCNDDFVILWPQSVEVADVVI